MRMKVVREGLNMDRLYSCEEIFQVLACRKIQAIKHLRERTGLGLKDAKDLIDQLDSAIPNECKVAQSRI